MADLVRVIRFSGGFMIRPIPFLLSALFFARVAGAAPDCKEAANLTSCDKVQVDCSKNTATIGGKQFHAYCGASTPNGKGTLKSYDCPTVPASNKYHAMSGAKAMSFNPPLGGDMQKLLHSMNPTNPTDQEVEKISGYSGWGCVVICPKALEFARKNCQGKQFEIVGAKGGGSGR